jgi:hypothetical protein
MSVKALKALFLYTNIDIVPIPVEMYKTHTEKAYIFAVNKK